MISQFIRATAAFLLFAAMAQRPQAERIIAVGDVHGELDVFVSLLQKSGLIDEARHWSGGTATLVQLGDLVDRGPKSRALLDFLMTLQQEASRRGGRVRVSLGNHEVMNIMGDLRYVGAQDYAAFADSKSEQRRKEAFRAYSRFEMKRGRIADEEVWTKARPLGFVEYREAFGPQGKYGKWLRSLPAVNQVGDSLFLHGGINPELNLKSIGPLNSGVSAELQALDKITRYMIEKDLALPFFTLEESMESAGAEIEKTKASSLPETADEDRMRIQILEALLQIGNWLSVHPEGPLWFRGYDRWDEVEGEARLVRLTQDLGVSRIVVAHTPQANGEIRRRFGGKVFLIDTGLYRGRPSALEISNGRIQGIYLDRQTAFE